MAIFNLLLSGANQGLIWGLFAIGVFITFRILDIADLTVEGSVVTGAATAGMLILNGVSPWIATLIATIAGGLAGLVTAILHTKLKIPAILAGILTMLALYTVNLAIMGPSIGIESTDTIFGDLRVWFSLPGKVYAVLILGVVFVTAIVAVCYWYFGTSSGATVRATGNNANMCRAQGIHTDNTKIIGLVLSNALVGLCGALIIQSEGGAQLAMGAGSIVIGLASVVIGETLFGKPRTFILKLVSAVVGSVVYRLIITFCMMAEMNPDYQKLISAAIVAVALSLPTLKNLAHKVSVSMAKKHPWYAAHVKLAEEAAAARQARRAETAARRADAERAKLDLRAQEKENKYNAWKEANPKEAAEREEARLAQIQSRKEAKAKALRLAAEKQDDIKARSLIRAKTRLSRLEQEIEKYQALLSALPESDNKYHKTAVRIEAVERLLNEQKITVSMLDKEDTSTDSLNLKITNLSKTFNKGTVNEKNALVGIDLEINKGDFITVIGGNGAGKSTLLNMVSAVYEADGGRIFLDGIDVTAMQEYKRAKYLGRVFQDPMMGTAAGMEIAENLALAAKRGMPKGLGWSVTKRELEEFSEELSALGLGLETRLLSKVGLLSGGQRQAITLLMATLVEPKLLLLDEHTAALDPKTAKKVLDLTSKITSERQLTTLMITHNMNDAIRMGNRLIMMHEGRIIYDVSGEQKAKLTVADLMNKFETVAGEKFADDKVLLSEKN